MNKKTFNNLVFFLLIFFMPFSAAYCSDNDIDVGETLYQNLKDDWHNIFPQGNRNAGGPLFYKYILNQSKTLEEFYKYNSLYCPVSSSLIQPNSRPDFVSVSEVGTNQKICGYVYRCCLPCSCDLIKYSQTQKINVSFDNGLEPIYALTIKNPCSKRDFPAEVNRDYFCSGEKLNSQNIEEINDRLIIGMLLNPKTCNQSDLINISENKYTGGYCPIRNSTSVDQVSGGMGDIFIKMAR